MVAAFVFALAAGFALFVVPGAFLVLATHARPERWELPGFAFAASLTLLFASFAIAVVAGLPLSATPLLLAALTVAGCYAVRIGYQRPEQPVSDEDEDDKWQVAPQWWPWIVLVMVVVSAAAAAFFAPRGSIDRWWYLAYVRAYLERPQLSIEEPFLGTANTFARFNIHPWLMGLALWARVAGADPVWLYERVAPLLIAPLAVSSAWALARAVFRPGASARLCVLASVVLWGGGLVPLLARAGEDKILAQALPATVCTAAFLRSVRGESRWVIVIGLTALATASVHALVYALAITPLLAFAGVRYLTDRKHRASIVLSVAVLLGVATYPAAVGIMVRGDLAAIGAELKDMSHPVVRVHEERARLVHLGRMGYVVHPRLVAHPLLLIGLMALPLLAFRKGSSRDFLLAATVTGAAVAFFPPLTVAAGTLLSPWMVYRALWMVPFAALAAFAITEARRALGFDEGAALLAIAILATPPLLATVVHRAGGQRERVVQPADAGFSAAMDALRALPRDARIAAAPELSERLPALTGRHVVAALDRSTVVFAGSRERAEARLRLRAATLAGDPRRGAFEEAARTSATHAVYDPRSRLRPDCGAHVHQGESFAVCDLLPSQVASDHQRLEPIDALPEETLRVQVMDGDGENETKTLEDGTPSVSGTPVRSSCTGASPSTLENPGPWPAAVPTMACRLSSLDGDQITATALEIVPSLRSAVDEMLVSVRAVRAGNVVYEAFGSARASGKRPLRFAMEAPAADEIELRILSGFLAGVGVQSIAWSVGGGRESGKRHIGVRRAPRGQ